MAEERPLIQLCHLNKSYQAPQGALHVLKDVDLSIRRGEFVAITGSSGSGKSTLLNILGILDDYDSGTYMLDGTPIGAMTERRAAHYRNRMIGFVFQSFNLLGFKSAEENVALPLAYQGVSRKQRTHLAREYLEKFGLLDRAQHLPSELSGGQKQRVAIARALIAQPRIILADEPTGALDSETSAQVMQVLRDVNRAGMTLVVVTHEPEVAAHADRVVHLRDGRVDKDTGAVGALTTSLRAGEA